MKHFIGSIIVLMMGLVAAYAWGSYQALLLVTLLGVLEIRLSFDNAILNASVLQQMDTRWRR